jgi:hypothetical protein
VASVSLTYLTYNLKERTAFVNGNQYMDVDLIEIYGVGVSGTVDFDGDQVRLNFTQPVDVTVVNLDGRYALKINPAKTPTPSPRRRKRRKMAEIAEAWTPGTGITALLERARSRVEPALLPPRRTYEFPRAVKVVYDGDFHEIEVMYMEDAWMGKEKIKRKLNRIAFSNLIAPDLYIELKPADYMGFIKTSQGGVAVTTYEKPFNVRIAGREMTLGP